MSTKLLNFNKLSDFRKLNKKKTIILAHGTFDFIHHGHVKHLKKSKAKADILVVSITADKFVNKGPNRPIYNENKRAEILSHFDFVDYVVIVNSSTGVKIIEKLRPNFYSKGIEYKNFNKDISGAIDWEAQAVKKIKSEIFFTNEETMSSSNLINVLSKNENKELKKSISQFKKNNSQETLIKHFKKIEEKKILVIGDIILDEYVYTQALSKSPKEEIISVKENSRVIYSGGVLATANHLASFSNNITLLSVIDKNNKRDTNFILKNKKNITNLKLYESDIKNVKKKRYLDENKKKLFQSNIVSFNEIPSKVEVKIINFLRKNLKKYDLVLVNDFGHGLMTKKIIDTIEKLSNYLCVNVQTNSANYGYNFFYKYKKVNYLTLDEPEARLAVGDRFCKIEELAKKILKKINATFVSVTYGQNGTYVVSNQKKNIEIIYMPAFTNQAIDTMGAGDAYFAISSISAYLTKKVDLIGYCGNIAGALKIQYLGHEKFIMKNKFFAFSKTILS